MQVCHRVVIPGRLPGMNEIIAANRTHWSKGAKLKRDTDYLLSQYFVRLRGIKLNKISLKITWYEKNRRRDIDNISSGCKFILDTLQHCEIIENDNWRHVVGIENRFAIDPKNPRIEVMIMEVEDEHC